MVIAALVARPRSVHREDSPARNGSDSVTPGSRRESSYGYARHGRASRNPQSLRSLRCRDHLSLTIREGGVYGLLGPNGAGKSSTIRMMIGITIPDEGEVWLFGKKFHREQLQRVGYLPEERGLYKRMKVLDQLVFSAVYGLSPAEARKRALDWCQRCRFPIGYRRMLRNCPRACSRRSS